MIKFNWGMRACGVFLLWGMVAIALPAQTLTTLHSFAGGTDGQYPTRTLIQATDGNLYGTTYNGGATNNNGTIFKVTRTGSLTILHRFHATDGANPEAALVQATDGNLYGTAQAGGANRVGTVFKITLGGTLTTLHSFDGTDGAYPYAGLIQANDGNFYGTTSAGGANTSCNNGLGCGTVFKSTPGGALTTLYSFCSQSNCTDGWNPTGALVQAVSSDGSFFGTTAELGGTSTSCNNGLGCGTVFKITPGGTLTTLYSFCSQSNCTDGNGPSGLVQGTIGKFYGTTEAGGANTSCNNGLGCGTVFSLSTGLGPFVETNPASGQVGSAVNILGTNLTGATSVTFNDASATFTVVSKSLITTTVPSGAVSGRIQVVAPGGTLKSNVPFRVTP